jgi:ribosomal protein L33|tara:strand:+ start:1374 stop:1547 length:174 start_codon:yes stop_codon:yes gene_type:complete
MAKPYRIVKLVSEEGTGDYYTTTKPTKGPKTADKLRLKKYDKKLRRHVWFKEVRKLK